MPVTITSSAPGSRLRILHAIHDFLPRHRAGAEIYAYELARHQSRTHLVHLLCAEYDAGRRQGSLAWRAHDRLPVIELINNWAVSSFEETYASAKIDRRLDQVLDAVQPDVVHIHSLLNLSFHLPRLAGARGIPSVATLHDYTLVCPSGGQRVHLAEQHLCHEIDPDRCRRCFPQSVFHAQMVFARLAGGTTGIKLAARAAGVVRRRLPRVFDRLARMVGRARASPMSATAITERLRKAREVFEAVDLFVAPSAALAADFRRFGMPAEKVRVSDYGFRPFESVPRSRADGKLHIGFVGTLAWHKGVHVLLEAVQGLSPDRFELVIYGDPALSPSYVAALRERGRDMPVRFPGAFDHEHAREIYADLDVLVVPSLWFENSPLVIHEAFMAGVPVVGARQGGIPELVTHDRNGMLYDPSSSAELAGILQSLIDEPDRLRRLAAATTSVKTIDQDAGEWESRYREVLDRRRARH